MYIALYNRLHPDPFHPIPTTPHLARPRQSPHRGPTPPPPPQHGTTPPMPHPPTIPHEIEKSRKDVLDLTLRNPLLNFRPTKRRGVQVTDELSRELFALLVRGERVMYFLPAQESQTPPANLEEAHDPTDPSPDPDLPPDPHHHIPPELLALLSEPPSPPTNPSPTKPTTNSKPPSPCPSSTCACARPSGRPASRSRNRASTSSTSRSASSNGTSPTPAPPSVAPR